MKRKALLMGIDIGAGSLKVSIIDSAGNLRGTASAEVTTRTPEPGWSEQDPLEWHRGMCEAIPAALDAAGGAAGEIAAIAFCGGAHTPVLLDADHRVIRPAILWNDQRSGAESRDLAERAGEMILKIGMNAPNPTWTLPQLMWLQRHEPEVVARARWLLVAKDYLRFRITGRRDTDHIEAAGTLLADTATRTWSSAICGLIDWPMDTLPPIAEPTTVVGEVTAEAAAETGLTAGIPVVAGSMDTAVEMYGAGAVSPGQGVIKLATAGTVSVVGERLQPDEKLINYPHVVPGLAYTIVGTNSCASAHRWLKDQLFAPLAASAGADVFDEMDRMAAGVAAGAEGMIFHPYLQGERSPYWDPLLRADFIGMTMRHTGAHFVRALYEGIGFSLYDCIHSFAERGLDLDDVRLIGGGTQSGTWRQIVSDIIGKPIVVPTNGDASFGAALVAGVGAGVFSDEHEAVASCVSLAQSCEPDAARHALYQDLFAIYKDAQARLAELNHRIHDVVTGSSMNR